MKDDYKSRFIVYGVPLFFIFFVYIPLKAGNFVPLGFDAASFFIPLLRLAAELVQSGDWPTWTDRIGTGYPLFASTQINLSYPPFWPLLLARDPANWFSEIIAFHLVVGALGGIFLARRLNCSPYACALAGVLFSVAMPILGFVNRPMFFCANSYIPWILGAVISHKLFPSIWAFSMTLCATLSLEIAAYLIPISVAVRWLWLGKEAYNRAMGRDLVRAILLFTAFMLPVILPFLELLVWSERGDLTGTWRITANSFSLLQLLQFIAPTITGFLPGGFDSLFDLSVGPEVRFGQLQWIAAPVAGTLILPLVLCAVKKSAPARRLLYLAVGLLLLAMPTTMPLIFNLWQLPPLSFVRFPGKMMQLFWPMVALLAVFGIDQVETFRRTFVSVLVFLAVTALILLVLPLESRLSFIKLLNTQQSHTNFMEFWIPSLICALSFLTVATVAVAFGKKKSANILALLAIIEAGYFAQSSFDVVILPQETIATQIHELAKKDHSRISVYVTSGNSVLDGISARDVRARYLEASGGGASLWGHGLATEQSFTGIQLKGIQQLDDALFSNLPGRMRAFSTDYLLVGRNIQVSEDLGSVASWQEAGIELYELRGDKKTVFHAQAVKVAATQSDFDKLIEAHSNELDQVAIVRHPLPLSDGSVATAEILERTSKLLKINIVSDKPALIWSADAMGPGWRVKVNNETSQSVLVQGAFRGVIVPSGQSLIEWTYRPISIWVGLAISVCLLLLLVILTKLWARNDTKSAPQITEP
jgi:hypothetical protein